MDPQLPKVINEDQEIQELINKLNATPKLSRWIKLFLDPTNKETFGNRTQSAAVAYSVDLENHYWTAATIGKENYKKLQSVASEYFEKTGMTVGKQLDLLAVKAVNTTNAKYLITLLEITGVYQSKPSIAIQNNTQINNANIQVSPEEEAKLDREFSEFIDYKYRKPPALNPVVTSNNTPD